MYVFFLFLVLLICILFLCVWIILFMIVSFRFELIMFLVLLLCINCFVKLLSLFNGKFVFLFEMVSVVILLLCIKLMWMLLLEGEYLIVLLSIFEIVFCSRIGLFVRIIWLVCVRISVILCNLEIGVIWLMVLCIRLLKFIFLWVNWLVWIVIIVWFSNCFDIWLFLLIVWMIFCKVCWFFFLLMWWSVILVWVWIIVNGVCIWWVVLVMKFLDWDNDVLSCVINVFNDVIRGVIFDGIGEIIGCRLCGLWCVIDLVNWVKGCIVWLVILIVINVVSMKKLVLVKIDNLLIWLMICCWLFNVCVIDILSDCGFFVVISVLVVCVIFILMLCILVK